MKIVLHILLLFICIDAIGQSKKSNSIRKYFKPVQVSYIIYKGDTSITEYVANSIYSGFTKLSKVAYLRRIGDTLYIKGKVMWGGLLSNDPGDLTTY